MRRPDQNSGETALFETKGGPEKSSAWACTVYSLVPFLGILFAPIAIILWVATILSKGRAGSQLRKALVGTLFALIILFAQIGLWWLLYLIPNMTDL